MAIDTAKKRMWGRYEYTLDDKSRLTVPARFRESLGTEFVMATGPDHSIRLYPITVWDQIESLFASRTVFDEFDPETNYLQRMLGNCELVSFDKDARLTIPKHFREYAKLKDDEPSCMVGNGSRVEIWNRTTWNECLNVKYTATLISDAQSVRFGLNQVETGTDFADRTQQDGSVAGLGQ